MKLLLLNLLSIYVGKSATGKKYGKVKNLVDKTETCADINDVPSPTENILHKTLGYTITIKTHHHVCDSRSEHLDSALERAPCERTKCQEKCDAFSQTDETTGETVSCTNFFHNTEKGCHLFTNNCGGSDAVYAPTAYPGTTYQVCGLQDCPADKFKDVDPDLIDCYITCEWKVVTDDAGNNGQCGSEIDVDGVKSVARLSNYCRAGYTTATSEEGRIKECEESAKSVSASAFSVRVDNGRCCVHVANPTFDQASIWTYVQWSGNLSAETKVYTDGNNSKHYRCHVKTS